MAAPAIGQRPRFSPGPTAKVDWSHPLSAGLRMCLLDGSDLVTGNRLSIAGQGVAAGQFGRGISFNGTAGASIPLDLTGAADLSIGAVASWPSFANNDALFCEFTPNVNTNNASFYVDPNEGFGTFAVRWRVGGGNRQYNFTRPAAGPFQVWNFDLPLTGVARAWFDAVEGNPTPAGSPTTNSGTYVSSTLYVAARNLSSLIATTNVSMICIWSRLQGSVGVAQFNADPFCFLRW